MQPRQYGRVATTFWTGETGRAIKARGIEASFVALYLTTSPHSNMLGLYYISPLYIAEETGLGIEGASKGLRGCIEAGFCAYDEPSGFVWVYEMAKFQIADALTMTDKRCLGVQRFYDSLPPNPYLAEFYERYREPFKMRSKRGSVPSDTSPSQGASKGHTSPIKADSSSSSSTRSSKPSLRHISSLGVRVEPHAEKSARGTRLPPEWILPMPWGQWAMSECGFDEHRVREIAVTFADYWHAVAGGKGVKLDWLATWRNWCRKERDYSAQGNGPSTNGAAYDERSRDRKQAFAELTGESSGDDIPPADVVDVEAREVSRGTVTKH